MAFKDVRDLTDQLHQLDYPNRFTISTLASPHGSAANFRRIADILHWLCDRLGPGATLAGGVRTEAERVVLVRSAAEFFVTRAGLRLNPRRLYASSSATAGELLKVTQLLIRAPQKLKRGSDKDANGSSGAGKYANGHDDDNDDDERSGDEYAGTFGGITNIVDLSDRIDDLRRARELSGQLTQSGATLYDQLGKEVQNRERRNGQATRPLELAAVERSLKTSVAQMTQRMETARQQLETARGERSALQTKVDRKAGELERMRQRLGALQKIRPAYLEEFERLEVDLQALFVQYALRVRCLDALRAQVAAHRTRSAHAARSPDWPLVKTSGGEGSASMPFLPDGLIDSDDDGDFGGRRNGGGPGDDDDDDDDMRAVSEMMSRGRNRRREVAMAEAANMIRDSKTATRLRVRTAASKRPDGEDGGGDGQRRFVGNMTGDLSDDDSSLVSDDNDGVGGGGGGGSYSDLDLAGGLPSDDDEENDDDDDDELLMRAETSTVGGKNGMDAKAASRGKTPGAIVLSDEDF